MTEFQTNALRHFYADYPQRLVPEMSLLNDNLDDAGPAVLRVRKPQAQPGAEVTPEPACGVNSGGLAGARAAATDSRLGWAEHNASGLVLGSLCAMIPAGAIGCLFMFW